MIMKDSSTSTNYQYPVCFVRARVRHSLTVRLELEKRKEFDKKINKGRMRIKIKRKTRKKTGKK